MKIRKVELRNSDVYVIPEIPKYISGNIHEGNFETALDNIISEKNKQVVNLRRDYLKKDHPTTKLFWLLTEECKGQCTYCYAKDTRENKITLNTDLFIDKCVEYGIDLSNINSIIIMGGEPLLYPEEILKFTNRYPHISLCIDTGLMIDDDKFQFTLDNLAPLTSIHFSLSIDPDWKFYSRIYQGKSFYKESIIRLAKIDKITPRWGLRCTIEHSSQSLFNLESDIRCKINDYVSIISVTADIVINEKTDDIDMVDIKNWFKKTIDDVIDDKRFRSKESVIQSIPYPVRHFLDLFFQAGLNALQLGSCCDGGVGRMALSATGKLFYCNEAPTINGNDDWQFVGRDEEYINKRLSVNQECMDCEIFGFCGGICFYHNNTIGINKIQCDWWIECYYMAVYAYMELNKRFNND